MTTQWKSHRKTLRLIYLLLLSAFPAAAHEPKVQLPFERPHLHDAIEGHFHTGWESRYFSEGRDSLNGDSLSTTSIELGWHHLSGGLWYGASPDQNYDELQLTLGLTETVGNFECYVAYTHLQFPSTHLHDDEVGLGGHWSGLPLEIEITVDAYYSFDTEGSFSEVALTRGIGAFDHLTLTGSGILGVNQGYVPDGHDGANHLALRVGAEYTMTQSLAIVSHAAYSWALDKNSNAAGDEQLIDFFHGSVGIQASF